MKKLLLFLMILMTASSQAQQVTTLTQTTPQKTVMATLYAAGSYTFQIASGMTNHQLTYVAAPSISALTVTVTMSTDGSTYGTACGSVTTTVGSATITCSGSYVGGKVVLSGVTGSGAFDATYYGQTTVANVFGFPKYFADGTAAAPSISFTSDTTKGFYSSASNRIAWATSGTIKGAFGTNLFLNATTVVSWTSGAVEASGVDTNLGRGSGAGVFFFGNATGSYNDEASLGDGTHKLANVYMTSANMYGKMVTYNGFTTAGYGVPAILASGRQTAQTAAVASVTTYTPTVDGSFEIAVNVLVTVATNHNFGVTVAYTDEGSTARTVTFNMLTPSGAQTATVVNANGAIPYSGLTTRIRAKGNTAITVATSGTFTTVTYNVEASIMQIS